MSPPLVLPLSLLRANKRERSFSALSLAADLAVGSGNNDIDRLCKPYEYEGGEGGREGGS